ncbi:hypothetical protein [Ferroplasma sp.]|uniref:hypothetical protein n=1 Tax=Ferroplasma sp. TaxID=2591003 RepID=UPI00307DD296
MDQKTVDLTIFLFVGLGLIMSITMIETIKGEQSKGLIKTFVSYPISPVNYIGSKFILYLIFDLISVFIGTFIIILVFGNLKASYFWLFILLSLFIILSSRAIFSIAIIALRINVIPEMISILFYFGILIYTFGFILNVKAFVTLFPFFIYYKNILNMPITHISIFDIIVMPILYAIFVIVSFIVIKFVKWELFYKYA